MMKRSFGFIVVMTVIFFNIVPANAKDPNSFRVAFGEWCPSAFMQICGVIFSPQSGAVGTIQSFNLPEKYAAKSVAVQCVENQGSVYYALVEPEITACALKICNPAQVTVCNTSVQINDKTYADDVRKIAIPAELLSSLNGNAPPTFDVRCDVVNGFAQYDVVNDMDVSCSSFLCQPTQLNICNSSVVVPSSAQIGTVLNLTTLSNSPVSVQCLGSAEEVPRYQVIDHECR